MRRIRYFILFHVMTLSAIASSAQSDRRPALKELPLSPTPIMGWSSWNHYGTTITEQEVRANADVLVSSGLRDLGYKFVNVDGSWEGQRDADGVLHQNPARFGDMKQLGDYLHSNELKFGIYSSPGPLTCGGFTASYEHEDQDAQLFADWGADYLKYDLCSYRVYMKLAAQKGSHVKSTETEVAAYARMQQALLKTGRPIYYALCQYGLDYVWEWAPTVGATMYRTTGDIKDNWISMTDIGFAQAGLAKYVSPGQYLDPDSLEIGNGGMTPDEYRVQFSLWSIVAAPLILGNDLTRLDSQTLDIIANREVIAVDQDPLGKPGDRVWAIGQLELWARPLKHDAMAIGLFNRNQGTTTMSVRLRDIGWSGPAHARDVWAHKDLPDITDTFTTDVPQHGVVMLVLTRSSSSNDRE